MAKKGAFSYSAVAGGKKQKEELLALLGEEARQLAAAFQRGDLTAVAARAEELLRQHPAWGFGWKVLSGARAILGDPEGAMAAGRKACQYLPQDPEVFNNQGNILKDRWQLGDARAEYEKAVRLRPDFAIAWNNLGNVLKNQGRLREALQKYELALRHDPQFMVAFGNLLLALHYLPDTEPEQLLERHRQWAERFCRGLAPLPAPASVADPEKRLTIGYLSADFGRHPVGIFMTEVLAHHDRERTRVVCYSDRQVEDDHTLRLKADADLWRVVDRPNRELAEQIRADGVDILVDLAGHTLTHRLPVFALKPAPVQVTWLGYPGTTGLAAIDYRLTDAIADPPGAADDLASEQLFRLADGFLCYPPALAPQEPPPLPVLDKGAITFGSFNFLPKVTEAAVACWGEILLKVPGSRLVLKSPPLADAETCQRLLKLFKAAGVAKDRVSFLGATASYGEHLRCYGDIDIALDTFPYNGTTTICEALAMGVPVITLRGNAHVSRVGASILSHAGLPELVTEDQAAYVRCAVDLAADRSRLAEMRVTVRQRLLQSPLCDGPRFASKMDMAFREMWRRHCTV